MIGFIPQELIRRKRNKQPLTFEEMNLFFFGYLENEVADYQVSAMLMAMLLNGMSYQETAALTKIMLGSGKQLQWDYPQDIIIDKHSTGGVGDKTSLVLVPLCALNGLIVPMMSGRGLGHTGGTLDKLEAIPGMNVKISEEAAKKVVKKHGAVFMGQTEEIAKLDKKLYALRDVTGTVESIALITASILSKKFAEGAHGFVFDVKQGSGAFMQEKNDAFELAETITKVCKEFHKSVTTLVTDMDSPLGDKVGNTLEVLECLEIMHGRGPESTKILTLELAAEMIKLAYPEKSTDQITKVLNKQLSDGSCFKKFCEIVSEQGGDVKYLENPKKFTKTQLQKEILAHRTGFIEYIDVRALGVAILELGGGRKLVTDQIDHSVGFSDLKRVADEVEKGQPLALIHANSSEKLAIVEKIVKNAYKIGDHQQQKPLIIRKYNESGVQA